MKKTLRIRERKLDVELTLWKMVPIFFMIVLLILSASVMGGSASPGAAPPMCD
ncbi:MAG: hypothetical protein ACXAC8_15955 [Candidatus Hodarchaeales archaeon]|jgi:hypothetical protein